MHRRTILKGSGALAGLRAIAVQTQPANMGPAEFQKLIRSEIDRRAKVIRAANIQPD